MWKWLRIALREPFKKLTQGLVLGRGNHGAEAVEQRGIDGRVVSNFVHGAVHEVGRGHVELPEVLGLPWRQGVRVDGLDIRKGHNGEHLQQLRAADFLRECADVFKVEDVAAQRLGHIQMEANELENGLALLGVKVEPREKCVREFHALGGMLAGAAGFAGVVEQEREEEEIEPVNLR
jgi:hypothetical protein